MRLREEYTFLGAFYPDVQACEKEIHEFSQDCMCLICQFRDQVGKGRIDSRYLDCLTLSLILHYVKNDNEQFLGRKSWIDSKHE
jgi:hypothetical protein